MRNKVAGTIAASIPLLLNAAGAFAGDLQFHTPATSRAEQTQTLLSRAAHAFKVRHHRTDAEHISDLWLFPTADDDTFFVQYVVTKEEDGSTAAAPRVHLELLTMNGERIVGERDSSRASALGSLDTRGGDGSRDWTASIGTGHAASPVGWSAAQSSPATQGVPTYPHWSASIGTGHVSDDSVQHQESANAAAAALAPSAHWTSRIGTGHAVDSGMGYQSEGMRLPVEVAHVQPRARS
jgi:hypothetical protein